MPQCIYCPTVTIGNEPPDHPLPEALGAKEKLPPGAVCRMCNDYLKDLDYALCNHPHLAGMIVGAQMFGKKNRIRTVMSDELEIDMRNQVLRIKKSKCTIDRTEPNVTHIHIPGPKIDEWKISRALHRSGLGAFALKESVQMALHPMFDDVRKYIRQPANRVIRPFLQRISDQRWSPRTMGPTVGKLGGVHFVAIRCPWNSFCVFYFNLIVDEFVVVAAGDFNVLRDRRLFQEFEKSALASGHKISSKPWLLQPGATEFHV
jgi:hypothetical protein